MKNYSKTIKFKNKSVNFHFKDNWRISDGGYYILMLLTFGYGANGFGLTILNFYFGLSITKNK
jgi:hypothetical protein